MQSMNDYYSAVQLRSDRWSVLREGLDTLAHKPDGKGAKAARDKVSKLFDMLALIETYWAFPGVAAFEHIRRQFEHGKLVDAAFAVRRVTRALIDRRLPPPPDPAGP